MTHFAKQPKIEKHVVHAGMMVLHYHLLVDVCGCSATLTRMLVSNKRHPCPGKLCNKFAMNISALPSASAFAAQDGNRRRLSEAFRLAEIGHVCAEESEKALELIPRPIDFMHHMKSIVGDVHGRSPLLVGELGRQVLILPTSDVGVVLLSFGPDLGKIYFPSSQDDEGVQVDAPDNFVSTGRIGHDTWERITKPTVMMVALYCQEVFPLPRLALGISSIARTMRERKLGQTICRDMQLGVSIDELIGEIDRLRPEIIGVSITFGQQHILDQFLEQIQVALNYKPLVIIGGSLAVLNADEQLKKTPEFLIAMGPGEQTMCDVVSHWWGELKKEEISDVLFLNESCQPVRTPRKSDSAIVNILPELDLLDPILDKKGVMQLEGSRGCTFKCAFCPRDHKGMWFGEQADTFSSVLPYLSLSYDARPDHARKIYMVDEEFLGYGNETQTLQRAKDITETLKRYGFRYETSARVDQVYRLRRDDEWHVDRMDFWRETVADGLDRCLFGIESGVDSILERMNKRTTSNQNVQAIRMLTACKVPTRFTYITFDPLMTMEELCETYRFQGRKDILITPLTEMSSQEIFQGLKDPGFVEKHSQDRPFYEEITYMLVSMEALIGAPYLTELTDRGLAGSFNMSMGRRESEYLVPLIGRMSHYCQCWIDRNFRFDYTLKSIEKYASEDVRAVIRDFRILLKRRAYDLLGQMLAMATGDAEYFTEYTPKASRHNIDSGAWALSLHEANTTETDKQFEGVLDSQFVAVTGECKTALQKIRNQMGAEEYKLISREYEIWNDMEGWVTINGLAGHGAGD